MLRKDLINHYKEAGFDAQEASSEVDFIIEMVVGLTPKDIFFGKEIPSKFLEKIESIIKERLLTRKPIQQIVGQAFFMGEKFFVNEFTLIPRPESEIIVLECLKKTACSENPEILDIGTGSGCLAIEVAKHKLKSKIVAVDICDKALEIAQKNAQQHKVQDRIDFKKSDIFSDVEKKFDVIISNPPYIPLSEKENLQVEVRDFEPANALFANDVFGVGFYKNIIEGSKKYLKEGGFIIFELGINQAPMVEELFINNAFKNIEIIEDIDSIDRIIVAQK